MPPEAMDLFEKSAADCREHIQGYHVVRHWYTIGTLRIVLQVCRSILYNTGSIPTQTATALKKYGTEIKNVMLFLGKATGGVVVATGEEILLRREMVMS